MPPTGQAPVTPGGRLRSHSVDAAKLVPVSNKSVQNMKALMPAHRLNPRTKVRGEDDLTECLACSIMDMGL